MKPYTIRVLRAADLVSYIVICVCIYIYISAHFNLLNYEINESGAEKCVCSTRILATHEQMLNGQIYTGWIAKVHVRCLVADILTAGLMMFLNDVPCSTDAVLTAESHAARAQDARSLPSKSILLTSLG